jgi:hypothetical protein
MSNRISALMALVLALLVAGDHAVAQSPATSGLKLEAKIPLGNVSGRIDHMAVEQTLLNLNFGAQAHARSSQSGVSLHADGPWARIGPFKC